MVSSQPPAITMPTISYADRAKSVKQRSTPTSNRPHTQPSTLATSSIETAASTSATTMKPSSSRISQTVPSSSNISQVSVSSPRQMGSLPSAPAHTVNGDVKPLPVDSLRSESQNGAAPNSSQKLTVPSVNVWDRRKEEMAQNKAKAGQAQRPLPSPFSENSHDQFHRVSSSSVALHSVTNHTQTPNGRSESLGDDDDDDAFVVRPRARAPLVGDDLESWPEVGKTVSVVSGQAEVEGGAKEHEKEESREGEHAHGPARKSVKTKWVPIPATELQDAADAQHRGNHMRHRSSQHLNTHQRNGNPPSGPASASVSGSGSQGQSRTHSVAGGTRQSASGSHAGSVSHSQTQSRTGSAQSSPPSAFIRGGRRLPEEGMLPLGATSRSISMRSSRTGSPQPFQASLPPVSDPATGHQRMLPSIGRKGSGSAEQDQPTMPPYYMPPPPRSYHSPHPSDSPGQRPYGLPPIAPVPTLYSTSGAQPQPPVPFAGTPPYSMCPPYGFSYPPYLYWPPGASHVAPEGIPPHMILGRPPVPGANEGTQDYRDTSFTLPPPAMYDRPGGHQLLQAQGNQGGETNTAPVERGRRLRGLSFGTIDDDVAADASVVEESGLLGATETQEPEGDSAAKPTPPFSIGVPPGESAPRIRSRTQSKGHTLTFGDDVPAVARTMSGQSEQAVPTASGGQTGVEEIEVAVKVIDLTDAVETKWEFGSTKQVDTEVAAGVGFSGVNSEEQTVALVPALSVTGIDAVPPLSQQPACPPTPVLPPIITTTNGLASAHSPSYSGLSTLPPLSASEVGHGDEWRVKDFGYGFGRKSHAPTSAGGDRREWQAERPEREHYVRPRRGSFGGNYGYERGGGFSGRRGRGSGRGYDGRGGYHGRTHARGGGAYHGRQTPFVVQQPPPLQTDLNGYYMPSQPPQTTTYYPAAYEAYSGYSPAAYAPPVQNMPTGPPLPMPISPVSFPLDSTRYYLLGQLEYYFSPQNMAQDFFLRQKMDSHGWISIQLIASFKRVRQLTTDLQLVKDVLALSSLVEVRDEYVRMVHWMSYVLPTAPPSAIDPPHDTGSEARQDFHGLPSDKSIVAENSAPENGEEAEEEEEEDVVFVLEPPTTNM